MSTVGLSMALGASVALNLFLIWREIGQARRRAAWKRRKREAR